MKTKTYIIGLLFSALTTFLCNAKDLVDNVNVYCGAISHLLVPTFPTVHLPNSPLRFYPDRYGIANNQINQFNLTHVSHRWAGTFIFSPYSGDEKNITPYYFDNESTTPYRYNVFLDEHAIDMSFAPVRWGGVFKLKFENDKNNGFILRSANGKISVNDDNSIEGFDIYKKINVRSGQVPVKVYVYMKINKAPARISESQDKDGGIVKVEFENSQKEVEVSYAISYVSTSQALENYKKELASKDYNDVEKSAKKVWENTLSKIKIKGGTDDQQKMFYTCLYRTYERMINISEDSKYFSAFDNKIHADSSFNYYTDDWTWDTYRCMHPLLCILNPKEQVDKIISYVKAGIQSGAMPTFPTVYGDMHAMNGNHYVSIILDAYAKGIRGFNLQEAYDICKHTIMKRSMLPYIRNDKCDLDDFYHKNGYFPSLKIGEKEYHKAPHHHEGRHSVSVTLAQAYDDWCMAHIAQELGLKDDAEFFFKRSYNYRNLFNPNNQFMAPKDSDGNWCEPFDPKTSGATFKNRTYYAENNAWTYTWDVPHNVADLINLFGSKEAFEKKLDRLFNEPLGRNRFIWATELPDSTAHIGQFTIANEPSLHIPYLYNYIGKPWKTQKIIRKTLDLWFRNDYMGIPGDEDGGAMSAFYIFSTIGFYPVTPGLPIYVIGSPVFEEVEIELPNGKEFKVEVNNYAPENKYVQSVKLNGKPLERTWISHSEIINGGTLEFEMGLRPNKNWGISESAIPPSFKLK